MEKFNQENAIAKGAGKAFININEQNYVLFYLKNLSAKITKNKSDIRVAGQRGVGHKATSWSGDGELEIYEVTSMYKKLFVDYVNQGIDRYFFIQVENEDPSATAGKETKVLTGCNFDEINIAELSGEDGFLEQTLPFTFEGVELLSEFNSL